MKRAFSLAARARGFTSPNPMVGAVMVSKGKIISEGYHRKAGTPHAEVIALDNAGKIPEGATLYVSLEPCCHKDKRTPPCTEKIIASGIKHVVVAMKDPNPKVSGKGIAELRSAGVRVTSGVLEEKALLLNEFYVKHITTGMPFVILKTAMTLDGKIATPDGESKWITGEEARKAVHRLRSRVDAVMTAIGTVRADNPRLTARIRGGRNPARIVIDPDLKIHHDAELLKVPPETTIVTKTINKKSDYLSKSGIKIINYKESLDLKWLLELLGKSGIGSLLIEGGASLNAHAFNDGIVDKVMFFIAPKIIGGKNSITPVGGDSFRTLSNAYQLRDTRITRIGSDFLIEGYILK